MFSQNAEVVTRFRTNQIYVKTPIRERPDERPRAQEPSRPCGSTAPGFGLVSFLDEPINIKMILPTINDTSNHLRKKHSPRRRGIFSVNGGSIHQQCILARATATQELPHTSYNQRRLSFEIPSGINNNCGKSAGCLSPANHLKSAPARSFLFKFD